MVEQSTTIVTTAKIELESINYPETLKIFCSAVILMLCKHFGVGDLQQVGAGNSLVYTYIMYIQSERERENFLGSLNKTTFILKRKGMKYNCCKAHKRETMTFHTNILLSLM